MKAEALISGWATGVSFEWKWLAILFWPMFLFHVAFIATGYGLFVRFRPRSSDVQMAANDLA